MASVNSKYNEFNKILNYYFNESFPKTTVTKIKHKTPL